MLNTLYCYTEKWKLCANINKTKIVVFRKGGIVKENEKWFYKLGKLPPLALNQLGLGKNLNKIHQL
jgi:hypothetical protein